MPARRICSNGGTPLLHLLIQLTQAKVGAQTRPENTDPRGSKNVFGLWFGLRADALISIYEFMCAPERESHPSAVNMECLGKQLARLGDLPKLKAICCWPLRAMVLFFLLHFLFFSVAINSQQKLQKSGNDPGTFSSRLASSYAGHQHRFYSTFYKLPSSRSLSLWTSSGSYFIWPDHPTRKYVTTLSLSCVFVFYSRHLRQWRGDRTLFLLFALYLRVRTRVCGRLYELAYYFWKAREQNINQRI